jgi:hypothetical protein
MVSPPDSLISASKQVVERLEGLARPSPAGRVTLNAKSSTGLGPEDLLSIVKVSVETLFGPIVAGEKEA